MAKVNTTICPSLSLSLSPSPGSVHEDVCGICNDEVKKLTKQLNVTNVNTGFTSKCNNIATKQYKNLQRRKLKTKCGVAPVLSNINDTNSLKLDDEEKANILQKPIIQRVHP